MLVLLQLLLEDGICFHARLHVLFSLFGADFNSGFPVDCLDDGKSGDGDEAHGGGCAFPDANETFLLDKKIAVDVWEADQEVTHEVDDASGILLARGDQCGIANACKLVKHHEEREQRPRLFHLVEDGLVISVQRLPPVSEDSKCRGYDYCVGARNDEADLVEMLDRWDVA